MLRASKNMMRVFLAAFLISVVATGCQESKPNSSIVNEDELAVMMHKDEVKKPENVSVMRFNNGVILYKDKTEKESNSSKDFSFGNNINFGPAEMKFGPKERK